MSEETTDTTPEVAETAGSEQADGATEAQQSETDWVAEARKWEKRAKENAARAKALEPKAAEYDKLAEASKTELERAQEAARLASDSLATYRERVASAELRAALTGIVPDPASVIEDLNLSRFIGEDGEVNTDAVAALRGKYEAAFVREGKRAPAPNPAQGSSASGAPDVSALIAEAKKSGDWKTVIALENQKLISPLRG